MADERKKQRNTTVDIIRAFAILMVVFGHTISGSSKGYENTLLFQIIWTLQMPLFFLLSGFVSTYAKPIQSFKTLITRIVKKTLAYILPWAVWTFLVRGLIFGETGFFDVPNLIYHMDSGYWFLFAIWVIVVFFDIAAFVSFKICKNENKVLFIVVSGLIFGFFALLLFVMGVLTSLDLLCIKLIVYYIPVYFAGFIYGKIKEKLETFIKYELIEKISVAICGIGYVGLISHFNFFTMEDSVCNITLRYFCSFLGCIAFCWFVKSAIGLVGQKTRSKLSWIGRHTLEIYLVHYLFLNLLKTGETVPYFGDIQGFIAITINYVIAVLCSVFVVYLIAKNSVLNKLLFWKREVK